MRASLALLVAPCLALNLVEMKPLAAAMLAKRWATDQAELDQKVGIRDDGVTGVLRFGGVSIGGVSGIFKGHDFKAGHWERPPYDRSTIRSVYHVRELANALGGDAYHAHNTPSGAIFWVDVPFVAALERPESRAPRPDAALRLRFRHHITQRYQI